MGNKAAPVKSIIALLCLLCLGSQSLLCIAAQAQTALVPANAALDLSSRHATMLAPNSKPVVINLSGSRTRIDPGASITPAEFLAVSQILTTGRQSLILSSAGSAAGGFAMLNPSTVSNLDSLAIPARVSTLSVGFTSATPLNVSGSALVQGALYFLQPTVGIASVANLGSLQIGARGLVSAALPTRSPWSGFFSSSDLVLNIAGNLDNHGQILSPGSLSMTIGGGSLVNSGLIQAGASINVHSDGVHNLVLDNAGGTVRALNGTLNFGDARLAELTDVTISGGNLQAAAINIFGRHMNVNVNQLIGTVNMTGSEAHLTADTKHLSLGDMNITGDPTWYNLGGDIVLNGNILGGGGDIAIIASGDITDAGAAGSVIQAAGHNILLVAGANLSGANAQVNGDAAATITFSGGSATGGSIALTQHSLIDSSNAAGAGGNITIVAFASGASKGTIDLGNPAIQSFGQVGSANGDVLIMAGGGAGGNSIQHVGTINSAGGTGGTGSVQIYGAQPLLSSSISVQNGSVQAGSGFFETLYTTPALPVSQFQAAKIDVSSGNISAGGDVTMRGGGGVYTAGISGRDINLSIISTASGDRIDTTAGALSASRNISIDANNNEIRTAAITGGGSGTTIDLTVNGAGVINAAAGNILNSAVGSGNGGTINLTSSSSITTSAVTADATGAGTGGTINIIGDGTITLGGNISAQGAGGQGGGTIKIDNGTNAGADIVSTAAGNTINASGSGVGNGTGGTITIVAQHNVGLGALIANGAASGAGGTIDVTLGTAGQNLNIGGACCAAGNIASLSTLGNGGANNGIVSVTTAGDISVTSAVAADSLTLITTSPSGSITTTAALTPGSSAFISAPSVAIGAGGLAGGGDISIITDHLTIDGTISSSGNNAHVLFRATANALNVDGTSGIVLLTGGGAPELDIESTNSSLNLNSSLSLSAGAAGVIQMLGTTTTNFGAGVTVSAGPTPLTLNTPSVVFGAGSTLTSTAVAGTGLTIQAPAGSGLTFTLPDNGSATVSTAGAEMRIIASTFTFSKSAGINTGTINFSGGKATVTASAGAMTIDPSVIVSSDNFLDLQPIGSSFIDNGTVTNGGANGTICIEGFGIAFSGSPNPITMTGGGNPSIVINGYNGGATFNSNYTFNPGANGTLQANTFTGPLGDGSLTIASGRTLSVIGQGAFVFNGPVLTFGNGATLSVSKSTGTAITVESNFTNLTVNSPGGGAASIITTGGAINFAPQGGGNALAFSKIGAGGSTLLLNANGGGTTMSTDVADITVDTGVAVQSGGSVAISMNNSTLKNSGSIVSSAGNVNVGGLGPIDIIDPSGTGSLSGTNVVVSSDTSVSLSQQGISGTLTGTAPNSYAVNITGNGTTTLGNITTTAGPITVTGFGGQLEQLSGTSTVANGGSVQMTNHNGGNIALDAGSMVKSNSPTASVVLTADGSISGTGTANASSVTLIANTGNIGTSAANRLNTIADTLSITANGAANGNAWVNDADAITLNASSVSHQMYVGTSAAGDLTVGGALSGDDIRLNTFAGAGGNIVLNANVGTASSTNVSLTADGSITGSSTVAGATVNLTATTGNVGTSSNNRINTSAGSLLVTANANTAGNGNAWINQASSIAIGNSSVNKQLAVDTVAAGNITVSGAVTGDDLRLTTLAGAGGDIIVNGTLGTSGGTTSVNVLADHSISGSGTTGGNTVNLTATSGDIGSVGNAVKLDAPNVVANALAVGHDVYLSDRQTVNLSAPSQANGGTFSLTATNSANIVQNDGSFTSITANRLEIATTDGNIGVYPTNAVYVSVDTLAVNTGGVAHSAYIINNKAIALDTSAVSGDLRLEAPGTINVIGNVSSSGGDLNLTTTAGNGNIQVSGGSSLTSTNGSVVLSTNGTGHIVTNGGDLNIFAGANIDFTGVASGLSIDTTGSSNGGNVILHAGTAGAGDILANTLNINTSGSGVNGAAGNVDLEIVNGTTANTIDLGGGNITANGAGTAATSTNGNITIVSTGSASFGSLTSENTTSGAVVNGGVVQLTVNTATPASVTTVALDGGTGGGNGGSLTVTQNGAGGFVFDNSTNIDASATSGQGGSVTINSGAGGITFSAAPTSLNVDTTNGSGGSLDLNAAGAAINIDAPAVNLVANSTSGTGATISLTSATLNYGAPADTFSASVNNSGHVSVTTTDPSSDITLGTGGGLVSLNASGPSGSISVTAGGSILNGIGSPVVSAANVQLTAQNGSIGVDANNRLTIDATNLTANAPNGSAFIQDTGGGVTISGASGANLVNGTFDLLSSGGGDIAVDAPLTAHVIVLTVSGSGNISQTAALAASDLTVGVGTGSANLTNSSNNVSTLSMVAGGNGSITFDNAGDLTIASQTGGTLGNVTVSSLGGTLTSDANIDAANVSLSGVAAAGTAVSVNGTINATGTINLTANGGGDLSLDNTITGGNVNLVVSGSGNINQTAALSGNNLSITVADGTADLTNSGNNFVNVAITDSAGINTGTVAYNDSDNVTLTAVNGPGSLASLSVTAGGALTNDANVTASTVDFSAGGLFTDNGKVVASNTSFTASAMNLNGDVNSTNLTLNLSGAGDIVQGSGSTLTGTNLTINIDAGTVNLGSSTNNFSQLTVNDSSPVGTIDGSVAYTNSAPLSFITGGTGTIEDLSITAAGALTPLASITVGGTLSLDTPNLILENPPGSSNDLSGNVVLISNSNGGLLISGSSTLTSNLLTSIFSATGDINFAPLAPSTTATLTLNGPTNITADATGAAVTMQPGVAVVGTGQLNITTPMLNLEGTVAGNPFTLHSSTGKGIIANPNGDVVLSTNLIFAGKDLAILASGNIIAASTMRYINLSNSKGTISRGDGGSLTMIAGYDFSPVGTPAPLDPAFKLPALGTYQIEAPSASGGSIYMPRVTINTSSTFLGGNGGSITVIAHAGNGSGNNQNAGTVSLGTINTNGSLRLGGVDASGKPLGIGGAVTIIAQGGVQTGAITTRGATGGRVTIAAVEPQLVGGPEYVIDGTLIGNGGFVPKPTDSKNGGAISIVSINSSATKLRGGDVTLTADQQIEVGSIVTSGVIGPMPGISAGGDVIISSLLSKIAIRSYINTSGITSVSSSDAGDAGDITLQAGSLISAGSLLAKGASNNGTGNGGAGGDITVSTSKVAVITASSTTENWAIGMARFGTVDARGGNAKARAGSGNGGSGGNITIDVGQLIVSGNVYASGGLKGLHGSAGTGGIIDLTTYAIQSVGTSLDLTSSVRNVALLPGGLFTIGSGGPVNGVGGVIVSDGNKVSRQTNGNGRVIDTTGINLNGRVKITVVGSTVAFNENGADVTLPFLKTSGARTFVTPSEALALYQNSRDQSNGTAAQTITLTVAPSKVGGTVTAGSISLDQRDINGQTFSSLKVPAGVTLSITGARPDLNLSTSTLSISGILSFSTHNSIDFLNVNGAPTLVNQGGQLLTDPSSTLMVSSTGGRLTNNGLLDVGQLVLARPTAAGLAFVTNAGATTQASQLLLSPSTNVGMTFSLQDKGGAVFNLPVAFGNFGVPAMYKTNATNCATHAAIAPNVSLTFALQDSLGNAVPGMVGGTLTAGNIRIIGSAITVGTHTTQTPLSIKANTSLIAQGRSLMIVDSADINLGDGVCLYAGKLKGVDPSYSTFMSDANAAWSSNTLIATRGSLLSSATMSINSTKGSVSIGSNDVWINNGPALRVTTNLGNISTGDNNTFRDMGGNVIFLAKGSVTGTTAAGNHFQAKGMATGATGAVEIGSGTIVSSVSAAFRNNSGFVTGVSLGSNVTIANNNNDTGAVVVMPKTGSLGTVNVSNSTLTLGAGGATTGGGAIQFDVNGSSASVDMQNSTFETKSSRPIAFTTRISRTAEAFLNLDNDALENGSDGWDTEGQVALQIGHERCNVMIFNRDHQQFTGRLSNGMRYTISGQAGAVVTFDNDSLRLHTGSVIIEPSSEMSVSTAFGAVAAEKGQSTCITVIAGRSGHVESHRVSGSKFASSGHPLHVLAEDSRLLVDGNGGLTLVSGAAFVDSANGVLVRTRLAAIALRDGSLAQIQSGNDGIRVRACSETGDVRFDLGCGPVTVDPGQEVTILDHQPGRFDLCPKDGVGRRRQMVQSIAADLHLVTSDFSLMSLFSTLPFSAVNVAANQNLIDRMLKTAAALQLSTQSHGPYASRSRDERSPEATTNSRCGNSAMQTSPTVCKPI